MLRVSSTMDNSIFALSDRRRLPPLRSLDPIDTQQFLHFETQQQAAWHPPHAGVSPTTRHVLFHPYRRPHSDSPAASNTSSRRGGRLPGIASLLNRRGSSEGELTPPSARLGAVVRPLPAVQQQHQTTEDCTNNKRRRVEEREPASTDEKVKADNTGNGGEAKKDAKPSRYLREMDRRTILQRLSNGEKQADLAKEFNVSRAAICNLNKHRDAVLSRQNEHPFAKHPKRRGYKKAKSSSSSNGVRAVGSKRPLPEP